MVLVSFFSNTNICIIFQLAKYILFSGLHFVKYKFSADGGSEGVAHVEAEGEVEAAVGKVIVELGVEAQGEVLVVGVLQLQLGGEHVAVGLGKVGTVPADALEEEAASWGYELMSVPVSGLCQQMPAAAKAAAMMSEPMVKADLRPKTPAVVVGLAFGGRDVLIEECGEVGSYGGAFADGAVEAEADAFVEERLDAGVECRELAAAVGAEEAEGYRQHGSVAVPHLHHVAAAQGEALLCHLPRLQQLLPVQPGVGGEWQAAQPWAALS